MAEGLELVKNENNPDKLGSRSVFAGIPAYNEEKTIAKIIVNVRRYVDKVIVVDDGSTDDTALIAEGLGVIVVRHDRNRGKGGALRTMFELAKDLHVNALVTLDADAQHDPRDIPRVIQPIMDGTADMVVGSRKMQRESTPRLRRTGQKVLDQATSVRDLDGVIVDSQSGFRAYSGKAIAKLDFAEPGMGAESIALKAASRLGLTIRQIPVTMKYQGGEDHSLNPLVHFSDVFSALVKTVVLKRPVRSLGIPGAVLVLAGLYWWVQILYTYNATKQFAIGNALVASVILLAGFFLGISAVILIAIVLAIQEHT